MERIFVWSILVYLIVFKLGSIFVSQNIITTNGQSGFNSSASAIIWLILGLSIINIYTPMEYINEKLFHLGNASPKENYEDVCSTFENFDYDVYNYVTRDATFQKRNGKFKLESNLVLEGDEIDYDLSNSIYFDSLNKYWNEAQLKFDVISKYIFQF